MKRNLFYLFSIIVLLTSCSGSKKGRNKFFSFEKEFTLKGSVVTINEVFKIPTIYMLDTLIALTMTDREKEKDLYLFSRKFRLIASTGKKGRGPGELMNPFFSIPSLDRKSFYIMDQARNKIFIYSLDSILKNEQYVPHDFVKLPSEYPVIVNFKPYTSNLFSFLNQFDKGILISFFDKKGNIQKNMDIPNNVDIYKNINYKGYSLLSLYSFSPDRDKLLLAYRFQNAIYILDKNGDILKKNEEGLQDIQDPNQQNIFETFYKVYVDGKYIFMLYLNDRIFKEQENGKPEINFPRTLFIYDWELNHVAKIKFDMPVTSLAIDHKMNKFITWNPEKGTFVLYDIPAF